MSDKDARSVLQCKDTLHGGHIILEGRLRLLDDGDVETILDKVVVNAPPAPNRQPRHRGRGRYSSVRTSERVSLVCSTGRQHTRLW